MILVVKAVVVGVIVVLGVIGAALAFTGKPVACADHKIPISDEARLALMSKWDNFKVDFQ